MTTVRPTPDIRNIRIVPLVRDEWLENFDSEEDEVDRRIQRRCDLHHKYRCRVYCAVSGDEPYAYGFYCLGMSAGDPKHLDKDITQDHDESRFVPFIYLHLLGVRKEHKGRKIGKFLLMDALNRSANFVREIGIYGVALNAISTDWRLDMYQKYGFRQRNETRYPLMILPGQTLLDLIAPRTLQPPKAV